MLLPGMGDAGDRLFGRPNREHLGQDSSRSSSSSSEDSAGEAKKRKI